MKLSSFDSFSDLIWFFDSNFERFTLNFYFLSNHQKICDFLMILEGIEVS